MSLGIGDRKGTGIIIRDYKFPTITGNFFVKPFNSTVEKIQNNGSIKAIDITKRVLALAL